MNSVFNGKIIEKLLSIIHSIRSLESTGNSIGAAMYINHVIKNKPRTDQKFNSQNWTRI